MRSLPLGVLIIPADAETPRMPKCRCLNLFRDIWPTDIAFGWEKFNTPLKMSVPSFFFMEKGDVYPAAFFIPSSPSVLLMWDQLSDGCLKTSIATLEVLVCVPWAQIPMHAERRGAHERAAPLCLIHPRVAGPCSQHPSPFSLRKTLSWVVAISTSCSWWRSVTASVFQWWWYESSQYLLRTVTTQTVTMLSNCL